MESKKGRSRRSDMHPVVAALRSRGVSQVFYTVEFEARVIARGLVTDVRRPSGYTSVYRKYGIRR
jgi:hypothetical protein